MKAFVCALVTLAVISAAVCAAGAFVSSFADRITALAEEASDAGASYAARLFAVREMEREIDENSFLLSLSVGHDEIAVLASHVADAKIYAENGDPQCLAELEKIARYTERMDHGNRMPRRHYLIIGSPSRRLREGAAF